MTKTIRKKTDSRKTAAGRRAKPRTKKNPAPPANNHPKGKMHRTLLHLMQLQELIIARAQQEVSSSGSRLTQLDSSIQTLLQELPSPVAQQFRKLEKRDPLAIVPVVHGVCSACGMALPVSLVQSVRLAEHIHQCPNCARLLYYAESLPRSLRRSARRSEMPKVGVERFSSEQLMIPRLESTDPEGVLTELCEKLEVEGFVDDAQRLLELALSREAIASTAVDCGLAFPHVRGVEGGGLTLALGLQPSGVRFGGASRTLSRVFFFMVIPPAASSFYLKLLSGLSQVFQKEEAREKLFAAKTPAALWKALMRLTKNKIR